MKKLFKYWSSLNSEALKELHPDLGLRDWNDLLLDEKGKIWSHLEKFFTDSASLQRKYHAIELMNEKHKYRSYGISFLCEKSSENATTDFKNILIFYNKNVVLELLSCFSVAILMERIDESILRDDQETDDAYDIRLTKWRFREFDEFADRLNNVFEHFGINIVLTRMGFIPRQEDKIIKKIYKPVLQVLSHSQWQPVNRELKDAFGEFRRKTKKGYSSCITHLVSSIEAFLQICVYGKTGTGTLNSLIKKAYNKKLIPNDEFTNQIFKNIESILMQERSKKGDSHPKEEYATEENALLIMNLTMIFLQHCMKF